MRLTKLEIVQKILAKLDSDEVTAISETVESEQVGIIVDGAYSELLDEQPWPHLRDYRNLEVTTDPFVMKIPTDIVTVNNVRYNKEDVTYLDPVSMKVMLDRETYPIIDKDPTFWTSYDDENITFNSYDGSLVASLSEIDCYKNPAQMTNDLDYPDLPPRFHQVLLNWALADAFYSLKGDQIGFNIYRKRAKNGLNNMARWAQKVNKPVSTGANVSYGRQNLS